MLAPLTSLIFPAVCPLCDGLLAAGNYQQTVCNGCDRQFAAAAVGMDRLCPQCAFPQSPVVLTDKPRKCPGCKAMPHRPAFDAADAMFRYDGAVKRAIVAAKYPANGSVIRLLGDRLTEYLRPQIDADAPPVLVVVPSRWSRRASRGGSGIGMIVDRVRQSLQLTPTVPLRTVRRLAKQAWMDDPGRWANMTGAFRVSRRVWMRPNDGLAGQTILLVDDVMTTGATADAAAAALKAAGAARVELLVIARAVRGSANVG